MTKPTKLKLIGIIALLLILFGAYKYYSFQQLAADRRADMVEQRQVLVDSWKAQGLTDQEIEQKLQDERQSRSGSSQSHSIFGVVRRMTGGTEPRLK